MEISPTPSLDTHICITFQVFGTQCHFLNMWQKSSQMGHGLSSYKPTWHTNTRIHNQTGTCIFQLDDYRLPAIQYYTVFKPGPCSQRPRAPGFSAACAWFLETDLVCALVCVCVCMSAPRALITSGMIRCDILHV